MPDGNINFDWIDRAPFMCELAAEVDFYRLFALIRSRSENCYLLESLALPRHQDRYHVIGFDPAAVFVAQGSTLRVEGNPDVLARLTRGQSVFEEVDPYALLRDHFPRGWMGASHQGGLIGYVCHEAVNYSEPSLRLPEHPDFGAFRFGLYLDGLIYDTVTATLHYFSRAARRDDYVRALLSELDGFQIPATLDDVRFDGHSATKEDFVAAVDATRRKIGEGYSFQAEVGIKSKFTIKGDKIAVYDRLRQVNPSPYMYYLKFGQQELMGASPEIMASNRQGIVLTTPAAGTIVRGRGEAEDARLAKTLLNDPKEIAEHNMLVDLHRNDIARVSRPGSVRVQDLMFIIKFSHVQHIMSMITGELAADKNAFDLLASLLPCGVVTGAPKLETIKIIAENEKAPRGPYGGAVGRFSFNGDCDFCLAIRSLFCAGDRCFAQTSAGIVYDSVAEKEYAEVIHKLAAMKQVLQELGGHFDEEE